MRREDANRTIVDLLGRGLVGHDGGDPTKRKWSVLPKGGDLSDLSDLSGKGGNSRGVTDLSDLSDLSGKGGKNRDGDLSDLSPLEGVGKVGKGNPPDPGGETWERVNTHNVVGSDSRGRSPLQQQHDEFFGDGELADEIPPDEPGEDE
jgi:hypothetical protein